MSAGMPQTDGWNYVPVAFAGWEAGGSRLVYIQYLVGQHPPTKYDAISGTIVLAAMTTKQLDHLPVLQFGYFQSPRSVESLHFLAEPYGRLFHYRSAEEVLWRFYGSYACLNPEISNARRP